MRQQVLIRSVRRCLGPTDSTPVAVVLWFTHRLLVPYALGAGIALAGTAILAGVTSTASIVMVAMGGVAVGSLATTEYRILAYAGTEVVVLRSGRFRQVANKVLERLPDDVLLERVGGNFITSEWRVGDRVYTTYQRSDTALLDIALSVSSS